MSEFVNIEEFINFKKVCPFCEQNLIPILLNYDLSQTIPVFKGKLLDDIFIVDLKYVAANYFLRANYVINTQSNRIDVYVHSDSHWYEDNISDGQALDIFFSLAPHVELRCKNKKCKSNYYISSNILYNKDNKINSFSVAFESCSANEMIIHNDWKYKESLIYSKLNNTTGIQYDFIDFDQISYDRLKTKISTIVLFS